VEEGEPGLWGGDDVDGGQGAVDEMLTARGRRHPK